MNKNRKKNTVTESAAEAKLKGFLDMIAPSVIQFNTDHYICGNTYRSVWALREYPIVTDEQAILRHLGEKDGVTLRIYIRQSKFFNGHTNITDSSFLTFGVKGLLQASRNVKDAMLFNILSYMSNELLTNGHTAASIDEFYLFLTNLTAVEYIRNFMKRVRKKDSAVILDLRNPTRSDGDNMLHLANKYMDEYLADHNNLSAKAKAEKYAKITDKTIISSGGADSASYGQNAFFYDAAEGVLTAVILLIAEFCPKEKRHIISVFKLIQDLLAPSKVKGRNVLCG